MTGGMEAYKWSLHNLYVTLKITLLF